MVATLTSTDLENDRCPKCGEALKLRKRPVAWRVQTLGGWILYEDEEVANRYAGPENLKVQGLYVRDGT